MVSDIENVGVRFGAFAAIADERPTGPRLKHHSVNQTASHWPRFNLSRRARRLCLRPSGQDAPLIGGRQNPGRAELRNPVVHRRAGDVDAILLKRGQNIRPAVAIRLARDNHRIGLRCPVRLYLRLAPGASAAHCAPPQPPAPSARARSR